MRHDETDRAGSGVHIGIDVIRWDLLRRHYFSGRDDHRPYRATCNGGTNFLGLVCRNIFRPRFRHCATRHLGAELGGPVIRTLHLPENRRRVAALTADLGAPILARFNPLEPATRQDVAYAFREVLRGARSAVGLTQEDLAHWAGWDRTYSSLLERGLRTPSLMQLLNLAPALSVRPGLLVDRTAVRLGRVAPLYNPLSRADTLARISVNAERLRQARGFTEDQFRSRTGLERGELLQFARGGGDMPITRLDVFARGLNCDVVDLLSAP